MNKKKEKKEEFYDILWNITGLEIIYHLNIQHWNSGAVRFRDATELWQWETPCTYIWEIKIKNICNIQM